MKTRTQLITELRTPTKFTECGARNCRICFNALQVKYYRQKAAQKEITCQF